MHFQDVIIWFGKDYAVVTNHLGEEIFHHNGEVNARVLGNIKKLYEDKAYIVLDVINVDLRDT